MPLTEDRDAPSLRLWEQDDVRPFDALKGVVVVGTIGSGKSSRTGTSGIEPRPETQLDR